MVAIYFKLRQWEGKSKKTQSPYRGSNLKKKTVPTIKQQTVIRQVSRVPTLPPSLGQINLKILRMETRVE